MHYFIIIIIISVIVIIQFRSFIDTKLKISNLLDIFPEKAEKYLTNIEMFNKINSASDEDLKGMLKVYGCKDLMQYYTIPNSFDADKELFESDIAKNDLKNSLPNISVNHNNETLKTITNSINDYLKNNKSVSDFHLMKDIVDRNCDAKEEEINTQIPIPLYMGLVGTMAGILVGILYLWLSGGISDLLSVGSGSSTDGVEALLGGVALAMISSILGISLTTVGSNKFKTAKTTVESNKHTFLSWIQAKLLPTLSDNVVGAIREMTSNLTEFNRAFSNNTNHLGEALAKVNESYKLQTQLIETVNKIQEGKTAAANLMLLNKLVESSEQIGHLADYLQNTNDYLANVRSLNEKLDLQETRTRTIEEMGTFFKTELFEIEARKGVISKAVGTVDDYLKQALEKLKENADNQFFEFQRSTVKQQDILHHRAEEINTIVSELKNLVPIKDSISNFEKAMNTQNRKLDNLVNAIQTLAKTNAEGANIPITVKTKMRTWKRICIYFGSLIGGLTMLALLVLLVLVIMKWESIFWYVSLFRY